MLQEIGRFLVQTFDKKIILWGEVRWGEATEIVLITTKELNSPSERPGSLGQEVRGGLVVLERGEGAGRGGEQEADQQAGDEPHLVLQHQPGLQQSN